MGRFAPWERGRPARRAALARVALILAFSHNREKGFVARDSYLISGGGLGFNHLDSRLRGNDGVGIGNDGVGNRE